VAEDPPTEPIEPAAAPAPAPRRFDTVGWLARNKVLAIALAILAMYLVRTNLESRRNDGPASGSPSSSMTSTASTDPVDDGESAVFVPRSTAPPPAPVASAAASPAPPTPEPKNEDVDFVMPDYTGRGLQSAQNDVQKHGVFFSRSDDLRGSRRQILDRNWKVCSQTPPAGERVAGSRAEVEGSIEFGVVKTDEDCPS
jgi:hypothetical protein